MVIIIIFVLAKAVIFPNKISDCKITNVDYPKEINRFKDFNISVTISNFGNKECMIWDVWLPNLYNSDLSVKENLLPKETKTYIIPGTIGGKAFQIIVQYQNSQQDDSIENGFITFNK